MPVDCIDDDSYGCARAETSPQIAILRSRLWSAAERTDVRTRQGASGWRPRSTSARCMHDDGSIQKNPSVERERTLSSPPSQRSESRAKWRGKGKPPTQEGNPFVRELPLSLSHFLTFSSLSSDLSICQGRGRVGERRAHTCRESILPAARMHHYTRHPTCNQPRSPLRPGRPSPAIVTARCPLSPSPPSARSRCYPSSGVQRRLRRRPPYYRLSSSARFMAVRGCRREIQDGLVAKGGVVVVVAVVGLLDYESWRGNCFTSLFFPLTLTDGPRGRNDRC